MPPNICDTTSHQLEVPTFKFIPQAIGPNTINDFYRSRWQSNLIQADDNQPLNQCCKF